MHILRVGGRPYAKNCACNMQVTCTEQTITCVRLHACNMSVLCTVRVLRVENFEVFLISRFSWVADDTKIIHMEGGINTRENL